jgi:hypothetical protein
MTKPFNIHDWQAKQRLAEAENNRPYNWKDKPGYNPDLLGNKYDGKQKTNKMHGKTTKIVHSMIDLKQQVVLVMKNLMI